MIKEFQKANGLTPDGVIGKMTLAKLQEKLNISDKKQFAHFMGQCHVESGGFTISEENLNYSANRLFQIFKKYYPTLDKAKEHAYQPIKIGSRVYANRMGNGSEESMDGFKYKGRGAIQTTGKANYKAFSEYVKEDCVLNPDLLKEKYFFESAIFFFRRNNIFALCSEVDVQHITKVTERVNGGHNGLNERIAETIRYYNLLK